MGSNPTTTQDRNLTTTSQPWAPATPALNGILGAVQPLIGNTGLTDSENDALTGLGNIAGAGHAFAPAIGNVATTLLNGGGPDRTGAVQGAYDTLQGHLGGIASQSVNPYDNAAWKNAIDILSNDIKDKINAQYAGMGYAPAASGDYAYQLSRGLAAGLAPSIVDAQNNLTQQRMTAANSLYGAGDTTANTLSGLDQARLASEQAGIGAATSAVAAAEQPYRMQLGIDALRRNIPTQYITQLAGIVDPIAQLGTTQNQTGTVRTENAPGLLDYLRLFGGGQNSPVNGMASALFGLFA